MSGKAMDVPKTKIELPVAGSSPVTSCEGCGVCCTEVSVPPYLDEIDFIPRELQREVYAARLIEDELTAQKRPCIWWDASTRKCIHHEDRPNVCREYEVGRELCLETRVRLLGGGGT
ncbi:MAG TPA: YkgJ family cysteine cluster protein [Humisphaera sp.]|nr:YkgJ family cysteine cluster protein [Humisphaera sp.]